MVISPVRLFSPTTKQRHVFLVMGWTLRSHHYNPSLSAFLE
ncbi:MAG: hypothetical protein V7K41_22675 [Nostoc sp.]